MRRAPRAGGRTLVVALALALGLSLVPPAGPREASAASSCPRGHIALTFDDGPSRHTPSVLDALRRRDVPATFFVVGQRVRSSPSLVRRQHREGHAVANHTYRHERLTSLSDSRIRSTVGATHRAIRDAGAPAVRAVRPPYGATSSRVRRVLRDAGYAHVLWSIDPQDWRGHSSSTIARHVTARLAPGAIILLHDGGSTTPNTVRALPRIIDTAHARGYCFGLIDGRGRVVAPTPPPPPPAPPPPPPPRLDDVFDRGTAAACPPGAFAEAPFDDLADLPAPMREAVACLAHYRFTTGSTATAFEPRRPVRRVDAAVLLTRLLHYDAAFSGLLLPWPRSEPFTDLDGLSPERRDAVATLEALGVTTGTGDGSTFSPYRTVTRRELAVMLTRVQRLTAGGGSPGADKRYFLDVPPGSAGAAEINDLAARGVVQGAADRTFGPTKEVSRAAAAAMIMRHVDEHVAEGRLPVREAAPPAPDSG